MKIINKVAVGFAFLSLVSMKAAAAVDSETETASKNLGAAMVTEISFDEGQAALNDSAKEEIRGLIKSAKESGKIDELKVAAWADREYPAKDTKASKSDIDLAKKRGENIKAFVKKELAVNDINTYNMTERPNALQKFFKTPTEKTKTALEQSGSAPKTQDETGFFGQKAKASKAVIMVYME
ncbi:MAG: hypothetical protein OM95_02510 [Bdellovibrio sp. ArHS]|uniref:hypothetical protein n=1 Tax=Bdellovibrio sp. ArHS TaxID=1569284 RepID=UPI0005827EDC|nr:hypothetical protein [Bdellovibrio sp. ArHS]KHD89617.1 MAG: hypothetical protein OM95_02510 [Bdellovibrio sp. ArHS]